MERAAKRKTNAKKPSQLSKALDLKRISNKRVHLLDWRTLKTWIWRKITQSDKVSSKHIQRMTLITGDYLSLSWDRFLDRQLGLCCIIRFNLNESSRIIEVTRSERRSNDKTLLFLHWFVFTSKGLVLLWLLVVHHEDIQRSIWGTLSFLFSVN